MAARHGQRGFGYLRKLPSGRWQASYIGPDNGRHNAPETFTSKVDAEGWLAAERRRVEAPESWQAPRARIEAARRKAEAENMPTFADYAEVWLAARKVRGQPLQDSTKRAYEVFLRRYLNPTFGSTALDKITPAAVVAWHESMDPAKAKTLRDCYSLGKAILRTACAADGVMPGRVNPFAIDGAGTVGRSSQKRTELIEDEDLPTILATIRPEWRAMVVLALGCGLRFGELAALRRSDVDIRAKVIHVRRAVGLGSSGRQYEKAPKSAAGIRDQRIPEAVAVELTKHLRTYVNGRDGLLFPSPSGTWLRHHRFLQAAGGWRDVRRAVGRPINFHDLRASGATRLARATANIAEVQAFLGDSSSDAAERYVRSTQSRMDDLTAAAFASLTIALATGDAQY